MLRNIFIQNYALIDQLELEFESGLNIITGETGAGKSIVLGALSLMLGSRADSSALLDTTKKCIVEGRFVLDGKAVRNFFTEHDLDFGTPVIIRREISSEGRSRSFINDTPVSLNQLKELGYLLVDIHSQHETLLLNKTGFQLSVVDAFAQQGRLIDDYTTQFNQLQLMKRELSSMVEEEKKSKADIDYYQFLFNELDEAALVPGEQEKLEEELSTLTHAEEIKSGLHVSIAALTGSENNILNELTQLAGSLGAIAKYNVKLEETLTRIKSSVIELKDISMEMDSIADEINFDPQRIATVNGRLDLIYRLQQKHRLSTIDELLNKQQEIESRLQSIRSLEENITRLTNQAEEVKQSVVSLAHEISKNRTAAIPVIEKEIKKLLSEVSLPNAVLKIGNTLAPDDACTVNGIDQVQFLFSANKGIAYSEISKVASGGELSRLMLCIKSSIAKLISLPTIILDEIDTGISGETAINVGKVLKSMARRHQLIAITHLPQIAGRGDAHYFVFKEVVGKKTFTKVRKLTADERIVEIARMLSGEKPSAIAIENAKELLRN